MFNGFLIYSYFKITDKDSAKDIKMKCADRAYLDLCRTIKFITDDGNKKAEYKSDICKYLIKEYDVLIKAVNSSDDKQTAFDKEHKKICNKICKKYSEISNNFYYGKAQKWLNMTLKYILMVEGDNALKDYLHIPIDSYILQTAGSDNPKLKYCLKMKCLPKRNGSTGKYSESSIKAWSNWEYEEYIDFQNNLKKAVKESGFDSPIEWENNAWIEVADYRK